MTKKMLEDYIKIVNKQKKILLIALIVISILFVGMTIFAFSDFEISKEEETRYEIEYEAETGDGDNSTISQVNDMSNKNENSLIYICVTVLFCIVILSLTSIGCVMLYGKIKNENKESNKKENNDKKE